MAILLVDAGGTITSRPGAQGALVGREAGDTSEGDEALPWSGLGDIIVTRAYGGLSENMDFADMAAVARAVLDGQARPEIEAIVVAHGTDTMEECAFFTDLVVDGSKAVVFTGAQRSPDAQGFDGVDNLRAAIATARHPGAAALGVMIVFAGRILPAAQAYKAHTTQLAGFDAHDGNAGQVLDGQITLPQPARRLPRLRLATPGDDVALLKLGAGMSPRALQALAGAGYDGIVIEAFGRGNASDAMCEAIAQLCAAGTTIALGTRCTGGGVEPDYDSGLRMMQAGALSCGQLPAVQYRIWLSLQRAQ